MSLATFQEREPHVPERELWLTVIRQAFTDAFPTRVISPWTVEEAKHRATRDSQMRAARSWFDSAGRDFREVCWLAGMQPEVVEALYRKRLNQERAA
jgi:hypothetical protein